MEDDFDCVTLSQIMTDQPAEPLSFNSEADHNQTHGKVFQDPIHETFRLGPLAVKIMDSPQFQRLRDLKQLGLTYYVYDGAAHNRFEHSVGVAHLAYTFASHYKQGQKDLNLTYHDLALIQIAGLCHDLGHGPFSHVFESCFLRKEGITNWSHEEMSVKIFDTIVEDKGMLGTDLSAQDCERIKAMILASHPGAEPESTGRQFLHEIVANGRNGLDVDKFDYLLRDAKFCGIKGTEISVQRLMNYSKVLNGQICYKRLAYEDVLSVYNSRAKMHRCVYGHRKARGIDLLVVDILRAANPVLKITDKIWDPRLFVQLDDTILKQIEFYDVSCLNPHEKDCMLEAQSILQRLRNRELYKYIGDWQIPPAQIENGWVEPTPEEVHGYLPPLSNVHREDIMLLSLSIDHTAGTQNPLKNVLFFNDWNEEIAEHLNPRHMSGFHYECYKECSLRVYCKRRDPESARQVFEAANRFVKVKYGWNCECSTPISKNEKVQPQIKPSLKRTLEFSPTQPSKSVKAS